MLPTGGASTLRVIKPQESLTEVIRERERIGRLALCCGGGRAGRRRRGAAPPFEYVQPVNTELQG